MIWIIFPKVVDGPFWPCSPIIHWRARFDAKIIGTGWLWRMLMTPVLGDISGQLARAAEPASVTGSHGPPPFKTDR